MTPARSTEDQGLTGTGAAQPENALAAAEQFLIDTCEAVVPDLPAPVLMDYLIQYRAHLAALVAAARHTL